MTERTTDGMEVLFENPHHAYAIRFIELVARKYGGRAVCFYTDPAERARNEHRFPVLRSGLVAASYDFRQADIEAFAAHLIRHHRIAAAMPFNEPSLRSAASLGERLGLSWNAPEVLRLFQDKHLLKAHLRTNRPDLRINASIAVESRETVLSNRRHREYRRFVLKPSSGYGNRNIGVFDSSTSPAQIDGYLESLRGVPLVMEEFVDGREYFVNGQVDAVGRVTVIAIFAYARVAANGRTNIDHETVLVRHDDPLFEGLAAYAGEVVAASGLKRSPFHLEAKVDSSGPCLIEVGARLAGHGNAVLSGELHGPGLDLFDLAAHYYLSDADYGVPPLDWSRYDAKAVRYVHGISRRAERIFQLHGIEAIEAMPEFHSWVIRPEVGTKFAVTQDLLTMPYSLILKGESQQQTAAAAGRVRASLQWNRSIGVARRLAVGARCFLRRAAVYARTRVAPLLRDASSYTGASR